MIRGTLRAGFRRDRQVGSASAPSSAVDQLANESAAATLAALYSLERLAQAKPGHRQTIVDLICGYFRIRRRSPAADASTDGHQQPAPECEESKVRALPNRFSWPTSAFLTTEFRTIPGISTITGKTFASTSTGRS
jgi:hypothetical protein